MRKLVALGGLLLLWVLWITPAKAQDQGSAAQEQSVPAPTPEAPPKKKTPPITPRWELSAGYTTRSNYERSDGAKPYFNGFYGSVDRNIFHWLGAEAELTSTWKSRGVILGNSHVYTLMVGPDLFPFGHRKVTVFGHVLYGLGRESTTYPAFAGAATQTYSYNVKAWEAGGGLEWNKWQHWSIRLIEGDFGGANFAATKSYGGSIRISAGVTYRIGQK
jgi:hypothetical protein